MWQALQFDDPASFYLWNLAMAGLLVSAGGLAAARLIRDQRPLVRHRVLCLTVALLVAALLLLFVAGRWNLSAVELPADLLAKATSSTVAAAPARANIAGAPVLEFGGASQRPEPSSRAVRSAGRTSAETWFSTLTGLMAVLWFAGALFVACRWIQGIRICRLLLCRSIVSHDDRLRMLGARACDAAQLDRPAPVRTSALAPGPLSMGIWRPAIVLSEGAEQQLDDEELLCVLTHEAAHIARHDVAIAWLQQAATCLFWWNPLLRAVHREIGRAREQICDDYVVRARGGGEDYARALVRLAEWCLDRPRSMRPAAAMLFDETHDLAARITRLTQGETSMTARLNRTALAALSLLLIATIAFGFVPVLRAESDAPPADRASNAAPARLTAFQNTGAAAASKNAPPERLSHNDGTAEAKRSIAGAAELVSFTLPEEGKKVAAIRIHGSRYGYPQPPKEDFKVYFLNEDLSETLETKEVPYSKFKRGPETWVEIKFAKPIDLPEEFWVGVDFNAEQTKGVYVSIDQSTDGSHSKVGQPGGEIRDANVGGDWMIEAVLAK